MSDPNPEKPKAKISHQESMVFGFDRATDEASLSIFLRKISSPEMLNTLIPRLDGNEIEKIVEQFTGLMKKHLSKKEYHSLFLGGND